MNTQPEALRQAEEGMRLHSPNAPEYIISAELRRLHEVNQELVEALQELLGVTDTNDYNEASFFKAEAALAKAQGEKE